MKYYTADFETTTIDFIGLDDFISVNKNALNSMNSIDWWKREYISKNNMKTEVWSAAVCEVGCLDKDKVSVFGTIDEFMEYLFNLKHESTVFFHNLQFDGSFIIDYLLKKGYTRISKRRPTEKTYTILITGQGRWFSLNILTENNKKIQIWNSLNLLPFSVSKIGKDFGTKYQKLEMDYEAKYVGYKPTEVELDYIKHDVLVMSEALSTLLNSGNNKMTIGSCCLNEFKSLLKKKIVELDESVKDYSEYKVYRTFFPELTKKKIDYELYGAYDADAYIRNSYRGGWVYVNPKFQGHLHKKRGKVADYNSMHPSMMLQYAFPVGKPTFWKGALPEICKTDKVLYFIRIKTKFKLKKGHFPCIQIKNDARYKGNEWLTQSVTDRCGVHFDDRITITLTQVDFEMIQDNYELYDFEILDGCYFECAKGLFDDYINKWATIKENSTGALRQLAKLFLNNLYGKFGTNRVSTQKIPYLTESGVVEYKTVKDDKDKTTEYVPVASFVTAYSRYTVIRAAEANYDTFAYADTDSVHILDETIKGIECDDKKLCYWKIEGNFIEAKYLRQKTYIELFEKEKDDITVRAWEIKCAGMSEDCKKLLLNKYSKEDCDRLGYNYTFYDIEKEFDVGLNLQGKLIPYRINGGVVLLDTAFSLRAKK